MSIDESVPDEEEMAKIIISAFDQVEYPGDSNICSSASTDRESRAVANVLVGKNWREMNGQSIRPYSDGIPLLTPQAFIYFLPMFLLNAISDESESNHNGILTEGTVFTVVNVKRAQEYSYLLTHEQKQVIAQFIRYYSHKDSYVLGLALSMSSISFQEDEDETLLRVINFWEQPENR